VKDEFNKPCKFKLLRKIILIEITSRRGRITLREESGLKARTNAQKKANL